MQRIALSLCTAALTLCASADADAEIYKWTDEQGRVHYGDRAPKGIDSVEVSEHLKDAATIYSSSRPAPPALKTDGELMRQILEDDALVAEPAGTPRGMSKGVRADITLVDYELSKADRQKIDQEVELIYSWFVDQMNWDKHPRYPLKIRIFGSSAAFSAYAPDLEPWNAQRSHYKPSTREIVLRGEQLTDDTIATLRHEASHAILDMELRETPFWINEGLAEVFESSGAQRGRLTVTPNPQWVEILKLKLREGSLQPLAYYFTIPDHQWRMVGRREERSYYMISWAMMSFLLSTPNGKVCLHGVIRDARKSGFDSLDGTFAKNCGDLKRLDAKWRVWIQNL